MARGPFQGAFQPNLRSTVVTAPDAIVYINGNAEVVGCPDCNRAFDFNKYITSITVDLNVDSCPGSASIQMAVPRHTIDDFYFNDQPVISPMMEVEIYAKGYYLLEGIPQYYPIFWGVITEVTDAYSGGAHTVSIQCADILKWWEVCKMNTNPALTSPNPKALSLFGNTFSGMNPYDIIFSLAQQSYGDVVVGTGSLITSYREQTQQSTFDVALSDLMLYWEQRFSRIRNGLLLYGTNGVAVRGDALQSAYQRTVSAGGQAPANYVANHIRNANGGPDQGQMVFDPTSAGVVAFRNNYSNIQVNLWQSEFQTKLELANAAKEAIGFEFFMDVDGSIVFKPPFYNLDVLSNKPNSWIQDIDIIDWDFSESEAEVVTQVIMQGSFAGTIDLGVGTELTPFSSVTDYHLLRKYGWRSQTYNSEFLADPQLMFYQGLDLLDRFNSRRHRGTVTIPMRPEMRLGFPVYIAPKDQIWYVTGISHNIAFGGRATTTLTLTAKRAKFVGLKGITTLKLDSMTAGSPPPKASGNTATGPGNSNSVNDPLPSTAFPYSSRQLSAQAKFTLDLGTNPAFLPAINASDSNLDPSNNPYDPVILRDPTSGRILGYPNVVMVYAQPFASAVTNLNNLDTTQGQHQPGANPAIQKTQKQKVTNNQQQNYANQRTQTLDQTAAQLREKHIVNRYTYGLTSAGRFVYAYDSTTVPGSATLQGSSGVIGEILTLPASHITVTPSGTQIFVKAQTALIRPVSDERGFEVVGHFKYGRRVSLRDGSLVLTGNTNSAVNVDMQLALGGNLYSTLTAQSQGLTAITSAYPNPADAVTKLTPFDLNTAAVIQPDGTATAPPPAGAQQLLGPSGYNALGGPQQVGSPPSVEATQLSKALTLAEMIVQDQSSGAQQGDPNATTCACMLERSDLQFLNIGYTFAPVGDGGSGGTVISGTASPDLTMLGNQIPGAPVSATLGSNTNPSPLQQSLNNQIQIVQNLQTQLDAVQSRADTIDQVTNPVGWAAAQQTISSLQAQIDAAQAVQTNIETQIETQQGAPGQAGAAGMYPAPKAGTILAKAEQFLVNLYTALDTPHQAVEHVLRGDYLPGGALNQPANYLNDGAISVPPLAPPFSPATASALGNPNAIAIAGQSNATTLVETWNQFGQQLQASSQRAQLQQDISQKTVQLQQIQTQIAALQQQAALQGSSVVVAGGQTAAQTIAALQAQAQQLQQAISNDQLQLAQLPPPLSGGGGPQTPTTVTG
jgi:hypothetical protein